MSFSSNELNFLIWRYLQESGFSHSAFTFCQESNLCESEVDSTGVSSGALTTIVQKGLYYTEAELCSAAAPGENNDMEKSLIESLSLMEAVLIDPPLHKVRVREKQQPGSSSADGTSPKEQKEQRERDREARTNHHNGVSSKKDRQQSSPRNNGSLGVHAKKQQAAQQASVVPATNGEVALNGAKDDLDSYKFPKDKVRFLKCHSSEVFICAWNPKNDLMASGSGDSTARIWDMSNSEDPGYSDKSFERRTYVLKHSSALMTDLDKDVTPTNKDVTSLDWNSKGDMLATGCYDGFARIWTRDGNLRCTLGAHKGPIFALKWNARGDYILSAGVDKTTVVWDANKCTQVQQFCFHTASALDVDWINDDSFASCSTDKAIHVSRLGCDKPVRTYLGHENEVNAIKFDPHSNRLASCSDDMTLRIWSLQDDKPVHVWKAHSKEIYTIRWSPLGHVLASASFDHTVRLWDVRRGESIRTLTRHEDPVYSVAFSPDGKYLASGCFDRSVFIWDIHNGKLLQSYVGDKSQGGIFEVSWNHRGDKVAASASDGTVILMDVRHIKGRLV